VEPSIGELVLVVAGIAMLERNFFVG